MTRADLDAFNELRGRLLAYITRPQEHPGKSYGDGVFIIVFPGVENSPYVMTYQIELRSNLFGPEGSTFWAGRTFGEALMIAERDINARIDEDAGLGG